MLLVPDTQTRSSHQVDRSIPHKHNKHPPASDNVDRDMLPAAVASMLPRPQAIARASVSALVASLPLLYVSLLRPPPAALAGDTAFWFLMSNCVIAAIVATNADAGTLLFRSSSPDDDNDDPCCFDGGGGGISCGASSVRQLPVVAAQGVVVSGDDDAVVPLAASSQDDTHAPAVDVDVNGGSVSVQEEAASAVTSSSSVDHALPTLIEGEEEEEEGAATMEPSTAAKSNTVEVLEAEGEEDIVQVIPLATIEEGSALADPDEMEPWSWVVLTSTKSLPEEGGAAAAKEEGLRRSATVGSTPVAEESEYWQLSDEELNRRVEDFIARFNREMRLQIEQEARV